MTKKHDELISILKEDHKEVKGIFSKLQKERDASVLESLVKKLHQELAPHMAGEETALYPALKRTEKGKEPALESIEEHQVAKRVLQELMVMSGSDESFMAKATVLKELVSHHVEEEENKVFKAFKKELKGDQAEEVLNSFQSAKNNKKEELEREPAMA